VIFCYKIAPSDRIIAEIIIGSDTDLIALLNHLVLVLVAVGATTSKKPTTVLSFQIGWIFQ